MPPLVSVLLPYRDVGATLVAAVESVLTQSWRNLELLAIDDGSRDDGPDIMRRFAGLDPRVRRLSGQGRGIVQALMLGLEHARGEYIARMDGDDICHTDRLAKQLAILEADMTLGVAGVQVEGFPAEALGEGMRRYIAWQNGLATVADHARELFVEAPLCHPSVMLRRRALDDVGGWRDVRGPEDYDLWLRLDEAGWGMAKVQSVLLCWRHRSGQLTFSDPRYSPERFRDAKAPFLARRVRRLGLPLILWGAGPTGKRMARALEAQGLRPAFFVDIDPKKIGRRARGVPIRGPDAIHPGCGTVVAVVGARGARELIRANLTQRGFFEGSDFLFAS